MKRCGTGGGAVLVVAIGFGGDAGTVFGSSYVRDLQLLMIL